MRIVASPRRVVVGVDGSPNSVAALRRAAAEARDRGARLDVVQVLEPVPGNAPTMLRTAAAWLRLRDLVARETPASQHVTIRLRIVAGRPGEALVEAAENAELLVVGARAHSEHGGMFGGDTVPVVRRESPCEMVVCADHSTVPAGE
ncbi:universal stress protein [Actinomadura kijaniata]|uniref:universal stress protein n=1 Tax=Actinomadura kijaniata TaxID=46161 RepID=UPI003F1AB28F